VRRAAAAAVLLVAAGAARAGDAPPAVAIREAGRRVLARPEFRYEAPRAKSLLEEVWDAFSDGVSGFTRNHPTAALVVFAGLAVLLVALVAHVVWTLRMARTARWQDEAAAGDDAAMRRGDPAPFRARAAEHAAAGRLDEAVRDLYAALLLTLDRRGSLRYASHKALLDYRMEAARDGAAARTLDLFAATYHPGSFGRRPPDRAHFDELTRALDAVAEPAR
jgi:hypothetical protein